MFLSWIKNCFYRHCLYRKENKSIQFNSTASCSHLVLIITLIFVWILSVKDVTWICFRRTFCNIFLDISGFWDGIWYIFVFDLICLFQWIVFICYVVSSLPHWTHHWVSKLDLLLGLHSIAIAVKVVNCTYYVFIMN